jgi:hypothetical protein
LAKLVKFGKQMTDAILVILKFVKKTTGDEPTQDEIANALTSYFILNEIGNQIKFLRKKQVTNDQTEKPSKGPFWAMNLLTGPPRNSLARVGLFNKIIQEAIQTAQDFVKKASGEEPSEEEIALSLKSSFILSEIKNQIDWQRKNPKKPPKNRSNS